MKTGNKTITKEKSRSEINSPLLHPYIIFQKYRELEEVVAVVFNIALIFKSLNQRTANRGLDSAV